MVTHGNRETDDERFLRENLSSGELDDLAQVARAVRGSEGGFVLVIGPVARRARTTESHVDVLAVVDRLRGGVQTTDVEVYWNPLDVFIDFLNEGKPIAFAALRDGKVAHDDGTLLEVCEYVRARSLVPRFETALVDARSELRAASQVAGGAGLGALRVAAKAVAGAVLVKQGVLAGRDRSWRPNSAT